MIKQARFSQDLALGGGTPKLAHTRYSQSGCRAITTGLSLALIGLVGNRRSRLCWRIRVGTGKASASVIASTLAGIEESGTNVQMHQLRSN